MLTGSVVSKFHGTGSLQASYVRTEAGARPFRRGAGGLVPGVSLLGERAQAAQRAVLGHPYGAG